jgi:hypothetical protein
VANHIGTGGDVLADAVRAAFTEGLADAMRAGAVIAVVATLFVAWRAPRRERRVVDTRVHETEAEQHEPPVPVGSMTTT